MPPAERVHLLYDVEPTVLTLCKQGANRQRIFLKKALTDDGAEIGVESGDVIRKAEGEDWSFFYCVVAEPGALEDPGVGDGRGSGVADMWRDEDEIRKAAHFFMQSPKLVTGLHDTLEPYGTVLENAIAQSDFKVMDPTGTEQTIKKGSWYVAVAPTDEGKRRVDQGEFTGLSLEGTGRRQAAELRKDGERLTVLRKVARYLGFDDAALAGETGTVASRTEEDDEVADTEKLEALEGDVQDLKKEQSATTTAITKLSGLVEKLVDGQLAERKRSEKEKDKRDEDEPSPQELKKSIEELTTAVNGKLDDLEAGVDKLLDGGTTQHDDPDQIRKAREKDPLAGILS